MKRMSKPELVRRDLTRDIWQETLDAVRDIKAGRLGEVYLVPVLAHQPTSNSSNFAKVIAKPFAKF